MGSNAPPPLRVEEVPKDFICSICFGVPLKPMVVTPCEHVFCESCITDALSASSLRTATATRTTPSSSSSCPMCRSSCGPNDVRPIQRGTLLYRIWSTIAVKCSWNEKGCVWNGSIVDAASHMNSCPHGRDHHTRHQALVQRRLEEEKERLEQRIEELVEVADENEWSIRMLTNDNERLKQKVEELERETRKNDASIQTLTTENERIKETMNKTIQVMKNNALLKLPVLFNGSYNFNRTNVVALSQLISRYLMNKPTEINSSRIFNCIRNCYMDLERGYNDNPAHYYCDVRMLLATCMATAGWFTDNQRSHITSWMNQQSWL